MKNRIFLIVVFCLTALPKGLLACEKCFGAAGNNPEIANGITISMLTLLLITAVLFGLIISFFLMIRQRTRKLASGNYIVNEQGMLLSIPRKIVEDTGYLNTGSQSI